MYLVGKRNNPWCLVPVLVGLYTGQKKNGKTINKQTNVKIACVAGGISRASAFVLVAKP